MKALPYGCSSIVGDYARIAVGRGTFATSRHGLHLITTFT